ncbi:MAG TPA: helix-turn-helix transcriptional regulator [Acidimicrobiales bacterium]
MPRRKAGALLVLEVEILQAALAGSRAGDQVFHGFGLAQAMGEGRSGRLIGHGTVYKALARLEDMGLLASRWEPDPPDGRPRRRLYELTAAGARAAAAAPSTTAEPTVRRGLAPGPA